jgi:hypothetical protein
MRLRKLVHAPGRLTHDVDSFAMISRHVRESKDVDEIARAKNILENPSLTVRITDVVGTPSRRW